MLALYAHAMQLLRPYIGCARLCNVHCRLHQLSANTPACSHVTIHIMVFCSYMSLLVLGLSSIFGTRYPSGSGPEYPGISVPASINIDDWHLIHTVHAVRRVYPRKLDYLPTCMRHYRYSCCLTQIGLRAVQILYFMAKILLSLCLKYDLKVTISCAANIDSIVNK